MFTYFYFHSFPILLAGKILLLFTGREAS